MRLLELSRVCGLGAALAVASLAATPALAQSNWLEQLLGGPPPRAKPARVEPRSRPEPPRPRVVRAEPSPAAAVPATATLAAPKIETVAFTAPYQPGSIVIVTSERKLYFVGVDGTAVRYGVAVGREDEVWTGKQVVTEKKENPRWVSPDGDDEAEPGPDNPLGLRALYLGWTLWRIHGTPSRNSIGQAVSNGCIRMRNEDVVDLYERVHVGAPVYAVKTLADAPPVHWAKKVVDEDD